jgi:hypothetical protein
MNPEGDSLPVARGVSTGPLAHEINLRCGRHDQIGR